MANAATKSIVIDVPPDKLFDVLMDFDSYAEFLQSVGLVGAKIESDEGENMVVTQSVKKMGKTISFTLRYKVDRPRKLSWSLIKGQMMSKNDGSWTLEEAGEGKTRATYAIEMKFGMLVPKALIKMMASKELPAMLDAFKKRAESL